MGTVLNRVNGAALAAILKDRHLVTCFSPSAFLAPKEAKQKLVKTSKVVLTVVDSLVSKDFGSAKQREKQFACLV